MKTRKVHSISCITGLGVALLATAVCHAQAPQAQTDSIETIDVIGSRLPNYTEITAETEKLMNMAGAFGDPVAAISTLPGIVTPVGGSEPAVRGSSPDDNNYYIDGIPAGYIFHEFNTSILDKSTIQSFDVYSAGFGAQYAGATGAVFDIRLRDPKQQALQTTVTASLLRAGVLVEGSVTENSAFYASYRKGLIQFFLPEEDEDDDDDGVRVQSPPEDDDYLIKYQWHINDEHQLVFNAFGASDFAEAEFNENAAFVATNPDYAGDAKIDNSFQSQGMTYLFNNERNEFRVIAAQWQDTSDLRWGEGYFVDLDDDTTLLKTEYKRALSDEHSLTLGVQQEKTEFAYDTRSVLFVCTEFDVDCQDGRRDVITASSQIDVTETSAYAMNYWQVTPSFSIETGVQFRHDDYLKEKNLHPRLALSWDFTDSLTLTSSAGRYDRFPDVEPVLPEFGNPELQHYKSNHYTLGLKGEIDERWNWMVETYYKTFDDLPLAIGEDEPDAEKRYANDTVGRSQGVDVFVNRNLTDRWYGWLALSYSRSERENQRTQETQEYRFDTPFVLNIVANRKISTHWEGGFRLLVKSGEANTEIVGIRENPNFEGRYLPEYGPAFEDRLPTYTRLDLRFQRDVIILGNDGLFFIDVINALNRKNIAEEQLDFQKVNETGELHIERESDVGIFPSVGVTFSF